VKRLPLVYNLESLRARWHGAVVAILGIAGTVAVFIATLALANGFRATLVASGSPQNAIVRRAGATAEMDSLLTLEQVHVIEDSRHVARDAAGPLVSPEVVSLAVFASRLEGSDTNVQVRGVGPRVLAVRPNLKLVKGRFLTLGTNEAIVGRNAAASYQGLDYGATITLAGRPWTVVGIFDTGGSALDSEVWCDALLLDQAYQRPAGVFQSVTARLADPGSIEAFRQAILADPRMTAQVDRETAYYEKASVQLTALILAVGVPVVLVMGLGSVFGALNTMYSAVAERGREVATLRAIGFGAGAVILSFGLEAMLIALVGGALGALLALPVNGLTTGTMNFQTFSHLSFAFRVTAQVVAAGIGFALLMGVVGGLPPAIRASRLKVADALRDL
jgi:putative ABC transport system permease protein